MNYVPILKARAAELEALSSQDVNCQIEPIFEIQHTDWDLAKSAKSISTDIAYFLDQLRRQWWRPSYIDLKHVAKAPIEREKWWAYVSAMLALPGMPSHHLAPVIMTSDTESTLKCAKPLASVTQKALIRVSAPCLDITSLVSFLSDSAKTLELDPTNVGVLIDWAGSTEDYPLDSLVAHCRKIISALPSQTPVMTAGTPDTVACTGAGTWHFDRREWWVWLRLREQDQQVIYGDYALFPPPTPGFGRPLYGHLRYSADSTLYVERQVASRGGLAQGFKVCCEELDRAGHFMGAAFSLGDSEIDKILHDTSHKTPGSSTAWRKIGLQHHLRLVCEQLTEPPGAPPPGTA